MKLSRDLLRFFDTRLLILMVATALSGFGIAHWYGNKVRLDYSEHVFLASLGYEIGFSQALWAVHISLLVAGLIVAAVTRVSSEAAKRLVVQLFIVSGGFAALSFAAVLFLFPEHAWNV